MNVYHAISPHWHKYLNGEVLSIGAETHVGAQIVAYLKLADPLLEQTIDCRSELTHAIVAQCHVWYYG